MFVESSALFGSFGLHKKCKFWLLDTSKMTFGDIWDQKVLLVFLTVSGRFDSQITKLALILLSMNVPHSMSDSNNYF